MPFRFRANLGHQLRPLVTETNVPLSGRLDPQLSGMTMRSMPFCFQGNLRRYTHPFATETNALLSPSSRGGSYASRAPRLIAILPVRVSCLMP